MKRDTDLMWVLIAGLPGSGKTTVAKAFSRNYGAMHISSDQVRRELGLWGHYAAEEKEKVYVEMLRRTENALKLGNSVIVDSTFSTAHQRKGFLDLAKELGLKMHWVLATASEETLLARVASPRQDSQANTAVFEKIKAGFEPLEPPFCSIDTGRNSPEVCADIIYQYINHDEERS